MPEESSPAPPSNLPSVDLLVVGALAIDRFDDGTSAPGGSALYGARAAAGAGLRVGVVTIAGPEAEAQKGLRELRSIAQLQVEPVDSSLAFGHGTQFIGPRRLVLEAPAARLSCPPLALAPAAVLYAPLADEFGADLAGQHYEGAVNGAILQGWLRSLDVGRPVGPLPISALPPALVTVLAQLNVLVASREDLLSAANEPEEQLDLLRACVGAGPSLVVTAGERGAWLDADRSRVHVPVVPVTTRSTIGAGDAFAAILLAELGRGGTLGDAATSASSAVAEMLRHRSP